MTSVLWQIQDKELFSICSAFSFSEGGSDALSSSLFSELNYEGSLVTSWPRCPNPLQRQAAIEIYFRFSIQNSSVMYNRSAMGQPLTER